MICVFEVRKNLWIPFKNVIKWFSKFVLRNTVTRNIKHGLIETVVSATFHVLKYIRKPHSVGYKGPLDLTFYTIHTSNIPIHLQKILYSGFEVSKLCHKIAGNIATIHKS